MPDNPWNCEACWHMWALHGPDGCTCKTGDSLAGRVPCPCEHTPQDATGKPNDAGLWDCCPHCEHPDNPRADEHRFPCWCQETRTGPWTGGGGGE